MRRTARRPDSSPRRRCEEHLLPLQVTGHTVDRLQQPVHPIVSPEHRLQPGLQLIDQVIEVQLRQGIAKDTCRSGTEVIPISLARLLAHQAIEGTPGAHSVFLIIIIYPPIIYPQ